MAAGEGEAHWCAPLQGGVSMAFEFPQENSRKNLDALWGDVWRIVEQLRLLEDRLDEMEQAVRAAAAKAATASGGGGNPADV